jgi:hypothetical protein
VDPVEEMLRNKMNDPHRREVSSVFAKWAEHHRSDVVEVSELHQEVIDLINPQRKSDHWLRRAIEGYVDTRVGGYVLTRSKVSEWTAATYKLLRAGRNGRDYEIGEGAEEDALRPPVVDPVTPVSGGQNSAEREAAAPATPVTPVLEGRNQTVSFSPPSNPRNPSDPSSSSSQARDREEKNETKKIRPSSTGVTGSSPPSRRPNWDDPAYWRWRQSQLSRRVRMIEEQEARKDTRDDQ